MALLSAKGEFDELKRVIDALDKLEAEEAEQYAVQAEPKKLSAESLSISEDEEYDTDETSPATENKLKIIDFYSDDDSEDDDDEDKSTIFSDEGSDEE